MKVDFQKVLLLSQSHNHQKKLIHHRQRAASRQEILVRNHNCSVNVYQHYPPAHINSTISLLVAVQSSGSKASQVSLCFIFISAHCSRLHEGDMLHFFHIMEIVKFCAYKFSHYCAIENFCEWKYLLFLLKL